ncbi:hypothetical protein [Mycoplasma sp. CSL7503-lung]|uniref:hypothetical protein n=1 Tax=Mycoplasma sp. CSL7503-lung TaxID=536372 RepID=UPI0021D0F566|nr:hypothetical protein [Mycoplasma sp. CSL7503-lung]MCU4706656.1 hypothetical protein [Mycoplasma sp. CSL7503-lung]
MNKKIEIYIDFEAITSNFLKRIFKDAPHNTDCPYIYTVGFYKDDNLILETNYIDLDKIWNLENLIHQTKIIMKKKLINSIRRITGIKNLQITSNNIDFLVWGNSLEDNIIEPMFGFKTKNIQKGGGISIDKVVPSKIFNEKYFKKMNNIKNQDALYKGSIIKVKPEFSNGALCSVLGAILILNNFKNSRQHKSYKSILTKDERSTVLDCIAKYNKDDVNKIAFIHKNIEKKEIIENQIHKYIKIINNLRNQEIKLNKINHIFKLLEKNINLNKETKTGDAINKIIEIFQLKNQFDFESSIKFYEFLPIFKECYKDNSFVLKNVKLNRRKIKELKEQIKRIKEDILPFIADNVFSD